MTLQRFLIGVAESRLTWLGVGRWKPAPAQRFPLGSIAVQILYVAAAGAIVGLVVRTMLAGSPLMAGSWWPVTRLASLGAIVGAVAGTMIAIAWNRRASQLRAAGLEAPPEATPTRWWQRWTLGPVYAFALFLITPLALWWSIDTALATRAWNRTRAELIARGEALTWQQLRPNPPADDENFAMSPLIRAGWDYSTGVTNGKTELIWKDPVGRLRLQSVSVPNWYQPRPPKNVKREPADGRLNLDRIARSIRGETRPRPEGMPDDIARRFGLVGTNATKLAHDKVEALQIANPTQEVLEFLKRFEPEMTEISQAARRPRSRFGTHWEDGMNALLPYLAHLKSLSTLYRIRSTARLHNNDTTGAFEDTLTAFRLADSLEEDAVLLSLLVRIAQFSIATASAWEGMITHRWSDAQLAELQARFAGTDFRQPLVEAFRGERVLGIAMFENMITSGTTEAMAADPEAGVPTQRIGWRLPARGILRWNEVHIQRLHDALISRIQVPNWPASLTNAKSDTDFLREAGLLPASPATAMAAMLAPALAKSESKAARQNATARLAEAACALERHRLRHGKYPESLDELVPAFLKSVPADPMDGRPVRYEPTEDGWFRLWSIGLNGRDDHGTTVDNNEKGDWVWPVPVITADMRLF